jgi:outer membrane protein OmpA-like peptidoglycan-associated protein/co-chaperonin GroES (HSP10)
MKYILSFLLLLKLTYASTHDYSIIIDEPFNNALFNITQDYDRSISAIGIVEKYENKSSLNNKSYSSPFDYLSSISVNHGAQIHLIKLDSNTANIILRKTITLNKFATPISLVKTPSNGYFVGGYTVDGSLLLVKLKSNGKLIFKKEFGTKNFNKMSKLILLRDGGVLAIGSSTTSREASDPLFKTGLGLNDIFLTRFTKNGHELWSKKYGTVHDDVGIDAVEAQDGSIIVLSQTRYANNKNTTIMRITQNGDKIWVKIYENKRKNTPYKIIKLKNNNFVISISQLNDMNKEQIRLIKFDLQKNTLIDKEVFTGYSCALKDIKEYSNSNIIGVGYVRDEHNTDGLAMLLDSDFNLLHQEHYGSENYDKFNSVKILNNSLAAIVGINTPSSSQESNMWIVKLNQDMTMAQRTYNALNILEELRALFQKEINSKTIQIKDDLTINLINKNLYFKIQKYELSSKQKIFLDTFSSKLFKFIKQKQKYIETLEINGHTSSEWGGTKNKYLKNEKLSTLRAYHTLKYMYSQQNKKMSKLLETILKTSGYSYSKKIYINEVEDKKKSRRVSFKIILHNLKN